MDGSVSVERDQGATVFKMGFKTLCQTIATDIDPNRASLVSNLSSRPQSHGQSISPKNIQMAPEWLPNDEVEYNSSCEQP